MDQEARPEREQAQSVGWRQALALLQGRRGTASGAR